MGLWWGQVARAPVVLGSATPDVESYFRAERGRYTLLSLPTRYLPRVRPTQVTAPATVTDPLPFPSPSEGEGLGEGVTTDERGLPPVAVVDMRAELKSGNTSIFSRELEAALAQTLGRGEQALLFLNRRGTATCVSCRDCGYVLTCRRCDIAVVYHRPDDVLVCHRCNRRRPMPDRCPGCAGHRIRYFGTGTQRVEQEMAARFPAARVIRWDRDTTGKRGAYEELWRAFTNGEADVMVGTQMIAKALDFPRVTLVGVVLADVGLFLPDFRAGERAYQLLAQMAGRGGRSELGGRAIVQTYVPDHYAVQAAASHEYQRLYEHEIAFRRTHGYPPLGRLVRLLYSGSREDRCLRETRRVRAILDQEIARQGIGDIQVIGPAPCFAERVRGRFRWALLLRGDRFARVLDRLELPPGWTIDVDPVSLL